MRYAKIPLDHFGCTILVLPPWKGGEIVISITKSVKPAEAARRVINMICSLFGYV